MTELVCKHGYRPGHCGRSDCTNDVIADLRAENARLQARVEEEHGEVLRLHREGCAVVDAAQETIRERDRYKARDKLRGEALNGAARLLDYISRRTDNGWAGMGELKHYKTLLASINDQAREGAILARAAIAATPDGEKEDE